MSISSKISAPAPQIFTSDPLEQIYAKGTLDPNMSGLSYMMLSAMGDRRERNQGEYLSGLRDSNATALMLSKMEEAFKYKAELSKLTAGLAKEGFLPSTMAGGADIFNGDASAGDLVARLLQDKMRSEIAKNNASAANSGGDKVSVDTDIFPFGDGVTRVKVQGRDAGRAADVNEAVKQQIIRQMLSNGNKQPYTADQQRQIREQNARTQYRNISE